MNLWRSEMLKYLFRYSSGIGLKIIVSPSDSHGFLEDETDGFYLLSSGIADGAILLEHMAKDQRIEYLKQVCIRDRSWIYPRLPRRWCPLCRFI